MEWHDHFFKILQTDPEGLAHCIQLAGFAYASTKYQFHVSFIRWDKEKQKGATYSEAKPENLTIGLTGTISSYLFCNESLLKTKDFSSLMRENDLEKLLDVNKILKEDPECTIEIIERIVNGIKGNIGAIPRIAFALYEAEPKKNGLRFLKRRTILRLIKEESKQEYN